MTPLDDAQSPDDLSSSWRATLMSAKRTTRTAGCDVDAVFMRTLHREEIGQDQCQVRREFLPGESSNVPQRSAAQLSIGQGFQRARRSHSTDSLVMRKESWIADETGRFTPVGGTHLGAFRSILGSSVPPSCPYDKAPVVSTR